MDGTFVTRAGSAYAPQLSDRDALLKERLLSLSSAGTGGFVIGRAVFHEFRLQHRGTIDVQTITPADAVARRGRYAARDAVVTRFDFAAEPLFYRRRRCACRRARHNRG